MFAEVWMILILVVMLLLILVMRYFAQRVPEKTQEAYAAYREDEDRIIFMVGVHKYRFPVDPEICKRIPLKTMGQITYKGDEFIRFVGEGFDIVAESQEPAHEKD